MKSKPSNFKLKTAKGFTLIELLVVIILLGVLAAIALPTLLGQVAKGRQSEAKATLGAINRAQQAYRYEKLIFGKLADLPVTVDLNSKHYKYDDNGTPNKFYGANTAKALDQYKDDVKNYAAASGQLATGAYNAVLCEDEKPTEDDVSTTHTNGLVFCMNGVDLK